VDVGAETLKIIFLGAPGSGKGTQASLLEERLGIPHISTGDILRDAVRRGTELGQQVEPIMKSGGLISDELMNAVVSERLAQDDVSGGFLLDGYPRTVGQAEALGQSLDGNGDEELRVFYLSVPDQKIVERIGDRLSCSGCGAIYHRRNSPPGQEGQCDRCGGELTHRADDVESEAVRKRLEEYHGQTMPVVEFYRNRGMLQEIDGLGDIESIFEEIRRRLNR
jgi:adenylate kinase